MDDGSEESTNIVRFLKTDPKARFQGYKFYFREGFCWIDVNSTYLKARLKGVGVFDVLSMSLFTQTQIPDSYFVAIINSELISLYVDNFINNTSHFQINDARQLPIIIPTESELHHFVKLCQSAIDAKKGSYKGNAIDISKFHIELDNVIRELYRIR